MERVHCLIWLPVFLVLHHLLNHSRAGTATDDHVLVEARDFVPEVQCQVRLFQKEAFCFMQDFKCVPDDLPSDLIFLSLQWNNIQLLSNDSFRRYNHIEHLDLSHNDITHIAATVLYPLKKLRFLDLSHNFNLVSLSSDIFKWSENLLTLNLTNCSIASVPNDIFRWLPKLTDINLSKNPFRSINITICPEGQMEILNLVLSQLENITKETFNFPCTCDHLQLQYTVIRVLDSEVIASLHVKSLSLGFENSLLNLGQLMLFYTELFSGILRSAITSLDIGYFDVRASSTIAQLAISNISELSFVVLKNLQLDMYWTYWHVLRNLSHIQKLDIFASEIKFIRPSFFDGMIGLRKLDLMFNEILYIDSSSSWKINLLSLDLSDNLLSYLDNSTFQGLYTLEKLDLSYNRILKFLSLSLVNLRVLNISLTALIDSDRFEVPRLSYLVFNTRLASPYESGNIFETMKNSKEDSQLQVVDLRQVQIFLYAIWDPLTKSSFFTRFPYLVVIDLEGNKLQSLPCGLFSNLTYLEELGVGSCEISHLDPNTFEGLISLRILCLASNNLISLPGPLFLTTPLLESLLINHNILTYLDGNLFVNTPDLLVLFLNENEFTSFNFSTFRPIMSSLMTIDVSKNPIECSCDLKWMITWFRNTTNFEFREGICAPESVHNSGGKRFSNIDLNKLCNSHFEIDWLIPFIVITLLVVIVIVIHSKWMLRYKLFLIKLAVWGYRQVEDARDHTDFQYDLNIMFTGGDELWATEFCRQVLEQLPEFQRIAFGDNGLPLGMYYLDAVLHVIENSFKTILLLSRAATHVDEFMMKLRIALNHMNDTNMQSTILIFLEDIPEEEMPYLIKLYLSEQMTFIYWEETPEGQRSFWKQLIKRLKVNVRRNDMVPPE